MWFKNLTIFRFQQPFTLSSAELESAIAKMPFHPCNTQETQTYGWISPFGERSKVWGQTAGACSLVTLRIEEKSLPSAVVNDELQNRILQIEEKETRQVSRKEKSDLKEQVVLELMPRAFPKRRVISGYIDRDNQWLIVNNASNTQVNLFTSALRTVLGTLPIEPLSPSSSVAVFMTDWVRNGIAEPFSLLNESELRETDEEGGVLRANAVDLHSDCIQGYLENQFLVTRQALQWEDRINFTLDDQFILRKLKFLEVVQEDLQDIEEAKAQQDAIFALMTGELSLMLNALLKTMSGESE